MEPIWIAGKRFGKLIFNVWFIQKSSSKNSIWRRAKKPGSSPWSRKDEDYSHKSRQTKSRHNSNADICNKPLSTSSTMPVELPQNFMVGQQRQQMSELQFDIFHYPQSFFVWKNSIQKSSDCLFWFSTMLWIKEVEMVDSLDELKSSRSVCGKNFPNFEMPDAGIASALNKIIQNSQFKKKVSLEWQKAQKEYCFLRGRQIAFMIYDHFRVTGAHDTVLDHAVLFAVVLHDDNIQEFDRRWDEVCQRFHLMISWKGCSNWGYVRSAQLKTVLELEISVPYCQKLKTMVKRSTDQKLRLRNFDARHGRLESGALSRIERDSSALMEENVSVTSGKKKASVRKETGPPRLLSQPYHEIEVCRGREVSEAKVTMGPFFDNCADIFWEVLARERLVNIGIRPSANSIKVKGVVRLETSVCFCITRLMNNQIKSKRKSYFPKRRESDDKCVVAIVKSVSQLVCVSQGSDALVSQSRKSRRHPMEKVLKPIQRVRFTESTQRQVGK